MGDVFNLGGGGGGFGEGTRCNPNGRRYISRPQTENLVNRKEKMAHLSTKRNQNQTTIIIDNAEPSLNAPLVL